MTALASGLLAWLLTYLIHSTVLLGGAWVAPRRPPLQPAAADLIWKVALLAGLVTGAIQSRLQLATPAAVRLPPPVLSRSPERREGEAKDLLHPPVQQQAPAIDRALATAPSAARPSVGPSLAIIVVLFWGVTALGSLLYYVAWRLILVGRLADRRAVAHGPLTATLAELRATTGYRRRGRPTMARTIQ